VGKVARRLNLLRHLPSRWLPANNLDRMNHVLRSRAVLLLVASRFVPGMRTIVLVAIGGAGTSLRTLVVPAFLAGFVYATLLIMLGWQVGESVEPLVRSYVSGTGWVVTGILLAILLFWALRRFVLKPTAERFLKLQLQPDQSPEETSTREVSLPEVVQQQGNTKGSAAPDIEIARDIKE